MKLSKFTKLSKLSFGESGTYMRYFENGVVDFRVSFINDVSSGIVFAKRDVRMIYFSRNDYQHHIRSAKTSTADTSSLNCFERNEI